MKSVWKHPLFFKKIVFLDICFVQFPRLNVDIVSCTALVKGFSDLLNVYDLIWHVSRLDSIPLIWTNFVKKNFFFPLFFGEFWPQNCFLLPIKVFIFNYYPSNTSLLMTFCKYTRHSWIVLWISSHSKHYFIFK